jgi:hypothetical protein
MIPLFLFILLLGMNKMDFLMMKKRKFLILLVCLVTLATIVQPAWAQSENALTLSLSKDFGYSGFGNDIQGTFSMKAKGPDDLTRVVFMIDGQPVGEVTSPPFRLRFDTGSYSLGKHTLSAIGYTSNGQELHSNTLTKEFVAASVGGQTSLKIILPVFGLIVIVALISFLIPAMLGRGKTKRLPLGAPRSYSPIGGTICPKCGRPFAMHVWGLNALVGKFDRCPYCGKWSLVKYVSADKLKEAEAAELKMAQGTLSNIPEASEEEKLRKDLENSRYQDL